MIRQTSIEAYRKIKENGLLGDLQFRVYEVLYNYGPLTQLELHEFYFKSSGLQPRDVQPRVSELTKLRVVAFAGKRKCRVSDNMCMTWDVTSNLPESHDAPLTKTQIIIQLRKQVASLQAEIAILSAKVMKKKNYQPPDDRQLELPFNNA